MTTALVLERTPQRTGRRYELDLLRIIAATSVLLFHYTFSAPLQGLTTARFPVMAIATRYGYLGVDLFFVISGYVVLMSAWDRRPSAFVRSRVVRLYPAYWIAVTLTAALVTLLGPARLRVTVFEYLTNLTMLNQAAHIPNVDVVYWTLWAELRFYLVIFALTLIGVTRRRVLTLLWGWLAMTLLLESHLLPLAGTAVLDQIVQTQWSHYFIAGMALYVVSRYGLSWQTGSIVLLALGNAVYRAIGYGNDVGTRYHVTVQPVVVACIVVEIFCVATLVAIGATAGIARPWFARLGALTYPLYLIHAGIGFVIFSRLGGVVNQYVLAGATAVLAFGSAYLLSRWVEPPFARRLNQFLLRVGPPQRTEKE